MRTYAARTLDCVLAWCLLLPVDALRLQVLQRGDDEGVAQLSGLPGWKLVC
jgi:hypothetical protein